MRAILKLVAVGAVIGMFGIADSIELYAIGGGLLLLMPFVVQRLDRRVAAPVAPAKPPPHRHDVTMNVAPLPMPRPQPMEGRPDDDDVEGKTVRAPMSHEEAYQMHARYAPSFDQQAAIARYEAKHGEVVWEDAVPEQDPPAFDQGRYAMALQYADAFEEQLTSRRRTAAYEVASPRRIARGSYTPQQYRAASPPSRSDQPRATTQDWETRTLVGVRPVKPAK